jgi:hypothetical protein
LIMSQALTLYTTPVIYVFFDKLGHLLHRGQKPQPVEEPQPAGHA